MIPLTKWLDPADYQHPDLQEPLRIVDQIGIPGQHEHRRWEYALALRVLQQAPQGLGLDVGGAGSPFSRMAQEIGQWLLVVDPRMNTALSAYVQQVRTPAPAVVCLSTLEHVAGFVFPDFLDDLREIVRPGGVLFLTFDIAPVEGPDTYHFRWMRERIFTPQTWGQLRQDFLEHGFADLGGVDAEIHPPAVYDYSFASLALRKVR